MDNPPGIIYIGGYGRSGSTVLDIVLGDHPELHSLGEFQNFFNIFHDPGMKCPCGQAYAACPEWSRVAEEVFPEIWLRPDRMHANRQRQKKSEHWLRGWRSFFPGVFRKQSVWYRNHVGRLFQFLFQMHPCRYLIDSSKSNYNAAWRPLALNRIGGFNIKYIHLVRHPEQVIASKSKLNNKAFLQNQSAQTGGEGWRGLVGWAVSNWIGILMHLLLPDGSYLRVRYEDLIEHPGKELQRIGAFIDIDLSVLITKIEAGEAFHPGHLMAGNRTAYQGSLVLEKTRSRARPHRMLRLANAFINFPLRLIFRYL